MEDNCNRQDRKQNEKKAENSPDSLYLYSISKVPLRSHKIVMKAMAPIPVTPGDYFNLKPI